MTTYRIWPATNGPGLTSYSGPWTGAMSFAVFGGGFWLYGYYAWVPTGGDTVPSGGFNCALWSITSSSGPAGKLVAGSTITGYAGTITANAWNFIPLPVPIQLAPGWDKNSTANGSAYLACVGWTASHGFPDTNGYWGSGGAGASGITNGPLIAYSSNSGTSNKAPYGLPQGLFSSSSNNPASSMPVQVSGTDNFWVDVQISDTAPSGYAGSSRIWPNKADANPPTTGDAAVNYTIATEISLSQGCALNNVWYFSPAASTTLATRCDVWNVSTGLSVASITSPTWLTAAGGAASPGTGPGGQWIKAAFAGGTSLPIGDYRVSVYNSAGSTDASWGPKDASTDYWGQTATNSVGAAGITSGPVSAPGWPASSSGFVFGGSGSDTPPWSTGGTTAAHAQPAFYQPAGSPTGAVGFPQLYAAVGGGSNQTQNYWVDLEATPSAAYSETFPASLVATGFLSRSAGRGLASAVTAAAGLARGASRPLGAGAALGSTCGKVAGKPLPAQAVAASTVTRGAARTLSASAVTSAALGRGTARSLAAAAMLAAAGTFIKAKGLALSASLTVAAGLGVNTGKTLGAAVTTAASARLAIGRSLSAGASLTGTAGRALARAYRAAAVMAASVAGIPGGNNYPVALPAQVSLSAGIGTVVTYATRLFSAGIARFGWNTGTPKNQ